MKTQWSSYGLAVLVAGAVLFQFNPIQAEGEKPSAAAKSNSEATRPTPFRGKIHALDPDARTVTLSGKKANRVLIVTDQTKITKDGGSASLKDARVGDEVGGQLRTFADGRHEAVSLRIGPKPDAPSKGSSKAAAKSD